MHMKRILRAGIKYLKSSDYRFLINAEMGMYNHMPDEEYLKRKYRACMGRELNLEDPQTFNEKLQWLKLHDRKPEYTMMVDKYRVREYIAQTIGEEYLIPLLGVWEDPEDIDFDALPDQFVLKCNHNSGLGMCICKDKSRLDIKKVKRELKKGLRQDYYLTGREWPYKDVPRRIIAEKYMVDASGTELKDYKIMCFDGKAKCSFVCTGRHTKESLRITIFDTVWNVLPFGRPSHPPKDGILKPVQYDTMLELAEILSKEIPFVRVDFYEVDGKIYFGELTFFPGSGFEEFTPEEWDYTLGEWIGLSQVQ